MTYYSNIPISHLSDVKQQRDGVVEVGVGTAGVDPQMPQDGKQSGARDQHTGHQENVSQDLTTKTRQGHQIRLLQELG